MQLHFCILKELGDVLDDGELVFLEATQTLEAAKRRIEELAEFWPGRYVVYDVQTGERMPVSAACLS